MTPLHSNIDLKKRLSLVGCTSQLPRLYFSDVLEEDISVLFKSNKEISYEMLMDKYKCTFQEEKSFLNDVKNIVQSNQKKYCMFLVDDFIVRDYFSILLKGKVTHSLTIHQSI